MERKIEALDVRVNSLEIKLEQLEKGHSSLANDFRKHDDEAKIIITEFREHKVKAQSNDDHISQVFSSFIQSIHNDVNQVSDAMHRITDDIKELIKKQDARIEAMENQSNDNAKAIQENTERVVWHWRAIAGIGSVVVFILMTGLAMYKDIAVNTVNTTETKHAVEDIHELLFPKDRMGHEK